MSKRFWDGLLQKNGAHLMLHYQPIKPINSMSVNQQHQPAHRYEASLRLFSAGKVLSVTDSFDEINCVPSLALALDQWVVSQVCKQPAENEYHINLFNSSLDVGFASWVDVSCRTRKISFEIREIIENQHGISRITDEQLKEVDKLAKNYPIWLDQFGCNSTSAMLCSGRFSGIKICSNLMNFVLTNKDAQATIAGMLVTTELMNIPAIAQQVNDMQVWQELRRLQIMKAPKCNLLVQGGAVGNPQILE